MKTQIQKLANFKNMLTLVVGMFALSVSAQIKVLNNGYLRMGNGAENSINAYGNVQQPFYFDGVSSTWRKLTFSNYPLDIAVAVGGDKTNNWNINGTVVVNPALSGQVIDYSGYIATSATTGWGVVKSTGTINIGGKLLLIEQTYTLPQASGYIGIKVKVTNTDATLTENVRVWVGTRDDWVGTSDIPRKQRGNIVNGAFVQNTTTAQQALALKISSGSEAVLVYTNSNRGQTSVASCCSFNNAMNTNPANSTFDVINDGSYAFYMRLNDLAPNASDEFTWYYAAGSLANIDNIINEVAQASGSVQNITCNTATYNATATANGTGYWITVPQGSAAPTAAQIKAGVNYGSVTVAASGNGTMTANTQRSFNISGLNQATNYTVYFVHEDAVPQFSAIINSNFTTVNPTAAITASGNTTICNGSNVTLNATSGLGLTYQWNNTNGAISGATNSTYSASTANTYTVTIGRTGCPNVTSAATQVIVNANPTVTVTANSGVAVGQTLTLSASGATTYSWSGPNGFTSNLANPTINNVSLAAAGTYTVVGTANGCSASANTTVVINQPAKALHFDGVDDWVNVTNMPAINAIPVTLEAYVKPEMRTENTDFYPNNILSNDVPGNYGLGMGININSYGSQITVEYKNGFRTFYDNSIVAGQWVHIAIVYTNGKVETYINGVLKDVVNHNQAPLNGNTNMFIGRHNDDAGYGTRRFFKGVIDEVRVWNRALCAQEITSQYNCQLNGVGNGLFANYNFDNGLAGVNNAGITTLNDTTVNNGNGILNNFALNGNTSNWILQGGTNGVCNNYIVGDINVKGNNTTIYDGTTALSTANFTNMGSAILGNAVSKSFTIENTGTGPLNISNINFTGTNAADFSVSGITLPATLAAGTSANITVSMNANSVGTRTATINITTDDCDESVYNFNVSAQISCSPVAISNCPQTQYEQIYADSNNCSAVFTYLPTITGTNATASYTFSGATTGSGAGTGSGSRFNVGQTTVTINVTGTCGTTSCSFVVTVVDNKAPKAISKNATVYLNAAGTASVTPADINNGSSDNCGAVTLSMSQTGTICGFATEGQNVTLTAPAGAVITSIDFASYGTPNGSCNNYTQGWCHATNSKTIVEGYALNQNSVTIPATNGVFGDPCGGTVKRLYIQATWTGTGSSSTFNCAKVGNNAVNLIVTDANGNVATAPATVTVIDTIKPNAVAQNLTVNLGTSGTASITASQINNGSTDNCSISSIAIDKSNFSCADLTFNTITQVLPTNTSWTVSSTVTPNTLACGLPFEGVSSLPAASTFTVTPSLNAYVTNIIPGTQALFSESNIRYFKKSFYLSSLHDINAEFLASVDNTVQIWINGVAVALEKDFDMANFSDNIYHRLVLGANGVNTNGGAGYQNFDVVNSVTASNLFVVGNNEIVLAIGNCSGTDRGNISFKATITNKAPATLPVNLTVTDASNNVSTANALVTVVDAIAPVITCPANISVFATSAAGAVVNYALPTATDNCTATVSLVSGLASGATFPLGTSTVTYQAKDQSGNTTTCSFTVTVTGVAPVIVSPGNITVNNDLNACGALVNYTATETTGIPASTITYSIAPGSNFAVGTVQVTATATNPVGTSSTTFSVTVVDNQAPTAVAQNVTIQLDANGAASTTATAVNNGSTDNCGIASVSLSKTSFDCTNVGNNNVTLTVTDVNGNVSTASAVVTVQDNIAPTAVAQNVTIQLDANGAASTTATAVNNGSTDNCGIASVSLSKTSFDCTNVGNNNVTLTVTDVNGNVSTASAVVTVQDNIAPTAVAQNVTIQLDANGSASTTATAVNNGSTDNCGIATVVLSKTSFDCTNVGNNNVTLTVTDVNGNVSTANAVVTVQDNIAPTAIAQNVTIQLDANGAASTTATAVNNGSNDNCGIASVSLSKTSFNCSNVGNNNVTLTVTDVNGNVSTASAVVTVQDNIAPTAVAQNVTIQLDASGAASTTATAVNNGSSDNCGIASVSLSKTSFNCSNVGNNNVTLTVTDVNGNVSTASAVVTVQDNIAPTAIAQNVTITLVNGGASVTAAMVNNGSYDNCGIANLSVSPSTFNCGNIGNNTVTLTVTDVNGNVSTTTSTVNVVGVIPSCNVTSAPRNNGTVIGSTNTLAAVNQMFLGYGAQSMNITCTATGGGPFTYSWSGSGLSNYNIANPVFTPTAGGNYTLTCTITNSYGCQTTCSITICVIDVRSNGGSPNNPKVLLCHYPPGNSNNPQTLSISISAVQTHLGQHSGDRLGSCNAVCGFAKTSADGDMYTQETMDGEINLIVYPNPSNSAFNFKLETESTEMVTITLYDMSGRMVMNLTNQNPTDVITIAQEMAPGVYMANVTQGEFVKTVKITKVN